MDLPAWLETLHRTEIAGVLSADPRTNAVGFLGVPRQRILTEAIEWGQADFDSPWEHLSPDDLVLLYAYFNQKGHIEELMHAFAMLFDDSDIARPVVIDVGCGPFTGGLALAA